LPGSVASASDPESNMNGNQRVVRSTSFAKETGNVWGFNFSPMPDPEFMANFDWRVHDPSGQIIYEFEAYMMRRLQGPDGPFLNMRFRDHSWREVPEGIPLIAELHSPAA
jgi:hypothetical protein